MMKTLLSLLTLWVGAVALAQSAPQTPEARARELQSRYMTGVSTELTGKLDTKSAVVGQSIALRTRADVTLADGKMIPAGTKLAGRVVAVHPKSDEQGASMLMVTIDQAVLKDGKMLPVRSLIRTLGANAGASAGVDPMARPTDANGTLGGSGIGGVTNPRGGGGGGLGSSANGGMGTTRGGRQVPPIGQAGQMGGAATPEATTQVDQRTVDAGESVTNRLRQTGVPGVLLATSPSDEPSGTLMEYGRNIVLENGTQITLGLISR
jgi:hypothetical protein